MGRATVFQKLRVYPEETPGVKMPAFRQLLCTSAKLKPDVPRPTYRPTGYKAPTTQTAIKEMTEGEYEGVICYNDIVWLLSSLLCSATITTPGGGTNSRQWEFEPVVDDPDDYISLTFETGSSDYGESCGHGHIQSMQLRVTKEEATLRGTLFAQELDEEIAITVTQDAIFSVNRGTHTGGDFTLTFVSDTIASATTAAIAWDANAAAVKSAIDLLAGFGTVTVTGTGTVGDPWIITFDNGASDNHNVSGSGNFAGLTGGSGGAITRTQVGGTLTKISEVPVDPNSISIALTDTYASLSTAILDRPLIWELNLGERFNQEFTIKASEPSFEDIVEVGLAWTGRLTLEHDSDSIALMDSLRDKETLFMQVTMTGPVIEGNINYLIEITMPIRLVDPDRDDENDVWAGMYDFEPIYDATQDFFIRFRVINALTTLE